MNPLRDRLTVKPEDLRRRLDPTTLFPEGTVRRLVEDRLREYAEQVREFGNMSPVAAFAGAPSPEHRIPK
jgi:hypothetical protein